MVTFITGENGQRQRVKILFQHEQFPVGSFPDNLVQTDAGRVVEASARTIAALINWPEREADGTIADPTSGDVLVQASSVCAKGDQFVKAEGCKRSLSKLLDGWDTTGQNKRAVWEAFYNR